MKAKVIATGEVIDVEKHSYDYVLEAHTYKDVNSGTIYAFYDLQFGYKETKRNTYTPEKINWEQRRFELVKAMLPQAAVFANDSLIENENTTTNVWDSAAIVACKFADAVIAKLKEDK